MPKIFMPLQKINKQNQLFPKETQRKKKIKAALPFPPNSASFWSNLAAFEGFTSLANFPGSP